MTLPYALRINLLAATLSLGFVGIAAAEHATVVKNPAKVAHREFDYDHQPPEMPSLHPPEAAQRQSQLRSEAALEAQSEQRGDDELIVTIRAVTFTLDCSITLWLPKGYDRRILDHEEGHRRITETFYAKAAAIAHAVCDPYVGRQITLRGRDLQGQLKAQLDTLAKQMTSAFQSRFDIEKTQQRYDQINDHGRKPIAVDDAIRQAFKETAAKMEEVIEG